MACIRVRTADLLTQTDCLSKKDSRTGIRVRTACTAGCGPRPALLSPASACTAESGLHATRRETAAALPAACIRVQTAGTAAAAGASESGLPPALRPRPAAALRRPAAVHCGIRVRTACRTAGRGPSCRSQVRTFSNAHKPDSNETRGKRRREAPPFPPSCMSTMPVTASPPPLLKSRDIGQANSRLGTKVSDFNPIIGLDRWRKQGMLVANRSRN